MLKLISSSLVPVWLCLIGPLPLPAAEGGPGLAPLQGKWSVAKTNRENQRYSQVLEITQDKFTFQFVGDDAQVRLFAKGTAQAEKAGPFDVLKFSNVQGGRSAEELAPVDDTRAAVFTVREGKLFLASNFDKERANENPGVDVYVRVATPKAAASASSREDKLLGNWKVEVNLAEQNIDYGLRIARADGKLTVTLISPRSGEYKAKSVTYKAEELVLEFEREIQGNNVTLVYKGKLAGDALSGTVTAKGFEDQYSGQWKAKKN